MIGRVVTVISLLAAVTLTAGCGGESEPAVSIQSPAVTAEATASTASPTPRESPKPADTPTAAATVRRRDGNSVVDATGRLSCVGANIFQPRTVPQPFSPLNAELAPEVLTVTSLDGTWRFAWEASVYREIGTRWSERNPAGVGSYGEHLALEFGPSGAAAVVAVRFTFEPDVSPTGIGVHFLRLPEGEELEPIEAAGPSGWSAWRTVEFPDVVASEPRLLAGSLGFEIDRVVLKEGWALRGIRAGSRLLTYPDAGLQECEGRLTSARVPSADRGEFGRLGSSRAPADRREWQIRFD